MAKLFVSPTGGSGVRVMNIMECPRKAKLYADGWRLKRTPHYFPFGGLIHRHAERPYSKRDNSGELQEPEGEVDPAAARADAQKLVDTEQAVDLRTGEVEQVDIPEKEKDRLPRVAQAQMEVWAERRYETKRVRECEYRLRAEPVNPDTAKLDISEQEIADLDFVMTGRLDLMVDDATDGHLCLRDIKTGKFKTGAFGMYEMQQSFYRYLWAAMGRDEVNDIGCFQLPKLLTVNGVAKDAGEVTFRPIRYDRLFEIVVNAVRQWREREATGDWPCNPTACEGKYNACPFLPICWAEQYDDPQAELEKTLERRVKVYE